MDLYNDTETRPAKVAEALNKVGLADVLQKVGLNDNAEKVVDTLASMTTIAGFVEKKDAAKQARLKELKDAKEAAMTSSLLLLVPFSSFKP